MQRAFHKAAPMYFSKPRRDLDAPVYPTAYFHLY